MLTRIDPHRDVVDKRLRHLLQIKASLFFVKMYNIYVTNYSSKSVYVRLHSQKISTANESFHHELERLSRGRESPTLDSQPEQSVNSYLVRWGFCNIPASITIPFPTEVHNDKPGRMYASLYAHSKLWVMDYEVNCSRYGCLIVKARTVTLQGQEELYLSQTNPSPRWIPRRTGDPRFGIRDH